MTPEELRLAYKTEIKLARIRANRLAVLLTLAADYHNPQQDNILHIRNLIIHLDDAIDAIELESKP